MKGMAMAVLLAAALAGCQSGPPAETGKAGADENTPNEKAAERAVQQYFQHVADWNLPAAYDLLSVQEQRKIPLEAYRKACEADRAAAVRLARSAHVLRSAEGEPLPNGAPYVMVMVRSEGQPDALYGAVPEMGAWRVILTDAKRVMRGGR